MVSNNPVDVKKRAPTDGAYTIVTSTHTDNTGTRERALNSKEQNTSSTWQVENSNIPKQTLRKRIFSWRSFMILLLHFSFLINNGIIITMSMAVVCMCGPVQPPKNMTIRIMSNVSSLFNFGELAILENGTQLQDTTYEFNWDSGTRGLLISSCTFGMFLVPLMSNVVKGYLGNKLTLTLYTSVQAILLFLTPVAARTSVYFLLAVRVIIGLTINASIPMIGDTLAGWIPAQEKLTSTTIVTSGVVVSSAVMPLIAGYFCLIQTDNGWPFLFYFMGILTVVWTIAWHFLSSRKPENHSFITDQEKAYILAHRVGISLHTTKVIDNPPYRTILTSRPILAFLVSAICTFWALMIIMICLPLYLTSVLRFSLQEVGVIITVMSCLRLPSMLFWSAFGNWLLRLKSLNTNKVRKICLGLGQGLSCVFIVAVAFFDEQHKWIATVLTIAAVQCMTMGVIFLNLIPLDMAPRYAGFIMSLGASSWSLVSVTAPLVVTALTSQGLYAQWRVIWITMAAVLFLSAAIFIAFGNASLQSWSLPKPKSATNNMDTASLPLQAQHDESAPLNSQQPQA